MTRRITISMDPTAADRLLELAGSSRKQGEYLEKVVNSLWENQLAGGSNLVVEDLRLRMVGLMAELNELRGRLVVVEAKVYGSKPGDHSSPAPSNNNHCIKQGRKLEQRGI